MMSIHCDQPCRFHWLTEKISHFQLKFHWLIQFTSHVLRWGHFFVVVSSLMMILIIITTILLLYSLWWSCFHCLEVDKKFVFFCSNLFATFSKWFNSHARSIVRFYSFTQVYNLLCFLDITWIIQLVLTAQLSFSVENEMQWRCQLCDSFSGEIFIICVVRGSIQRV